MWFSQFSHSVVSDSLRPHELQHARAPCPSPAPGVHPNSSPSSQWCHPAISSSVVPFPSCPPSLPASESFPMSQLFTWGGQSTGVSALASFLPKNTQGWSPLEWTGWFTSQSKGLSRVFSNTTVQKHQFFRRSAAQLSSQSNSHIHTWLLEKPITIVIITTRGTDNIGDIWYDVSEAVSVMGCWCRWLCSDGRLIIMVLISKRYSTRSTGIQNRSHA